MNVFSMVMAVIAIIASVVLLLSIFFQKKISKKIDTIIRIVFAFVMLLLVISVLKK